MGSWLPDTGVFHRLFDPVHYLDTTAASTPQVVQAPPPPPPPSPT